MGGANCSRIVKSVKDGREFILNQINGAPLHGMFPTGDACIMDSRNGRCYIYKIHEVSIKEWYNFFLERIPEKVNRVPSILPTVAGIYGDKPTKENPYVAMVRLHS